MCLAGLGKNESFRLGICLPAGPIDENILVTPAFIETEVNALDIRTVIMKCIRKKGKGVIKQLSAGKGTDKKIQ